MREQQRNLIDRRRFLRLTATAGTAAVLGSVLGGCSTEGAEPRSAASGQPGPAESASSPAEPTSSKALVAVFSWSGNTLQVADRIHELVPSDFFRIEPAEAYTTDHNAILDIARRERDEDVRPALAATVENWDEYGTVYLGFPIWWYAVPQIIKTFVTEHDLTGKTVAPFSTADGSSIESVLDDIRAICPDVRLTQGITLDGDAVDSQLGQADAWLGDLGLR